MFVNPVDGKATLKKSERDLLERTKALLNQIAKFAEIKEVIAASSAIAVALKVLTDRRLTPKILRASIPKGERVARSETAE